MTHSDPVDETDELRKELRALRLDAVENGNDLPRFRPASEFFADDRATVGPLELKPRRRLGRTKLIAMTGAAAAVIAVFAVTTGSDQPGSPATEPGSTTGLANPADAQEILELVSSATPSIGNDSSAYLRVDSIHQTGSAPSIARSIWQGREQSGVLIDGSSASLIGPANFGMQTSALTWADLEDLPTSSTDLLALLRQEAAGLGSPDWYVVKLAAELLAETPAPTTLRQGLWAAVASIDGVTTTGRSSDSTGRAGWNLTFTDKEKGTQSYIVDLGSGAILESAVSISGSTDTVRITYLDRVFTDTAPTVPDGCTSTACVPGLSEFRVPSV